MRDVTKKGREIGKGSCEKDMEEEKRTEVGKGKSLSREREGTRKEEERREGKKREKKKAEKRRKEERKSKKKPKEGTATR